MLYDSSMLQMMTEIERLSAMEAAVVRSVSASGPLVLNGVTGWFMTLGILCCDLMDVGNCTLLDSESRDSTEFRSHPWL